MDDTQKTTMQLLQELSALRQQLAALASDRIEPSPLATIPPEADAFASAILETTEALIVVLDVQGRILRFNRACERTTGYTFAEVRGKCVWDFLVVAEEMEPVKTVFGNLRAGHVPNHFENSWVTKAGQRRHIRWSNTAMLDGEGTIVYIMGTGIDITTQIQTELARSESEARFRSIVEASIQGIYIHQEGVIQFANPAMASMFGYDSPDELVGQSYQVTVAPHERERLESYRMARLRGEAAPSQYEYQAIRADGSCMWLECLVSRLGWQGKPAILAAFVDVSTRKQAAEALNARSRQQAVIAALGQRGLARKDLDRLLHDAVVMIAETLAVDYCKVLERLPDGSALRLRAGVGWQEGLVGVATVGVEMDSQAGYTLYANEPVIVADLRTETRFSGPPLLHNHHVISGISVIIAGQDQPFGVLGAHTMTYRLFSQDDIAFVQAIANVLAEAIMRQDAEAALQSAHNELEQRVRDRTAQLEAANEEVRRFAYIVSHDLRAPLINLKGFSRELRDIFALVQTALLQLSPYLEEPQLTEVTRALTQDGPEALSFIETSVTRMDGLIRAVLNLSRAGQRALYIEPVDPESLVRHIRQTLRHQLTQYSACITIEPLPIVNADRTAMEQILGNLLGNAVKYLEPSRPGEITVRATRQAAITTFQVCDNGRGIDERDIPTIFELFHRAGRQDTTGEGMGLSYVQTLVRRHGGEITCQSTLGVGTTFTFTIANHLLPAEPDATP